MKRSQFLKSAGAAFVLPAVALGRLGPIGKEQLCAGAVRDPGAFPWI